MEGGEIKGGGATIGSVTVQGVCLPLRFRNIRCSFVVLKFSPAAILSLYGLGSFESVVAIEPPWKKCIYT